MFWALPVSREGRKTVSVVDFVNRPSTTCDVTANRPRIAAEYCIVGDSSLMFKGLVLPLDGERRQVYI